jgi:hypothetical protein
MNTDLPQSRPLRRIILLTVCFAAFLLFAFTFWWWDVRPGHFFPPPKFLAAELRSAEKSAAFRSWADKIWSQRGIVDDRDSNLLYTFGQFKICKVGAIDHKVPPDFLCRKAWGFPREVGWVIDEQRQIVGVALSWGNMRGGLLIFPEGRPPAFRIEDGFEQPAADIIVVQVIS